LADSTRKINCLRHPNTTTVIPIGGDMDEFQKDRNKSFEKMYESFKILTPPQREKILLEFVKT
jgi:hypothetical protein